MLDVMSSQIIKIIKIIRFYVNIMCDGPIGKLSHYDGRWSTQNFKLLIPH